MLTLLEILETTPKREKVPFTPSSLESIAPDTIIEAVTQLQTFGVTFTGSISMYLHGVLRPDRFIQDIDIVVQSEDNIEQLVKRVPLLEYKVGRSARYKGSHLVQLVYGGSVKVDCFIVSDIEDSKYQGVTGISCIYQAKIDIMCNLEEKRGREWEKHRLDLLHYFSQKCQ